MWGSENIQEVGSGWGGGPGKAPWGGKNGEGFYLTEETSEGQGQALESTSASPSFSPMGLPMTWALCQPVLPGLMQRVQCQSESESKLLRVLKTHLVNLFISSFAYTTNTYCTPALC